MFSFEDFRDFGQKRFDTVTAATASATKGFQAIAAEAMDYSTKYFDTSRAFTERLLQVRRPDELVELQTDFAKSAYEEFLSRATKINKIYSDLGSEAFRELTRDVSDVAKDVSEVARNAPAMATSFTKDATPTAAPKGQASSRQS